MKTVDVSALRAAEEPAVQDALTALLRSVSDGGQITPAIETRIQNTIYKLRSGSPRSDAIEPLEAIASNLRLIVQANHEGLCNLRESRMRRLRKQLGSSSQESMPARSGRADANNMSPPALSPRPGAPGQFSF